MPLTEWNVVTVIVGLVGLFMTVGKPILSLNKNITTLNLSLQHTNEELKEQKKDLERQRENAHDSHKRLWEHNEKQDEKLQDHETRIGLLEGK